MAASSDEPRAALDALFWRDEILQVMYWMTGERLADSCRAEDLEVFLNGDADLIARHLERCAAEGYLLCDDGRYRLSDSGRKEAGRRFSDAFSDMQKQGHGECGPECDCHEHGSFEDCPVHGHPRAR